MHTIAVLSQKGGAGKTTLAVALAVAAQAIGRAAVVVDLDPQGTASTWARLREAHTPVVTGTSAALLGPVLEAARGGGAGLAGLVVLDTAPHVTEESLQALGHSALEALLRD